MTILPHQSSKTIQATNSADPYLIFKLHLALLFLLIHCKKFFMLYFQRSLFIRCYQACYPSKTHIKPKRRNLLFSHEFTCWYSKTSSSMYESLYACPLRKFFNKTTSIFFISSFNIYVKENECQEIKIDIGRMKLFDKVPEPSLSGTGFQANTM